MDIINNERIKETFYKRLAEEEQRKYKKIKSTSLVAAAAVFVLTSITVFAATSGVFEELITNFKDVSKYMQFSGEKSKSNGITMELSGYLADTKGMIPELVFTRDDGAVFEKDIQAQYCSRFRDFPRVEINNINRSTELYSKVSDDGKTFYCYPIVHYDIETITNSALDISVNRLVYNISESEETAEIDLYNAYRNADIKTYEIVGDLNKELVNIFTGTESKSIETEAGLRVDAVVFAKVKEKTMEIIEGMPLADGVDLAAISSHQYDNIVGIRFQNKVEEKGIEYNYRPLNILNNDDRLSIGLGIDEYNMYSFFRVDDFEDLKDMNGIRYIVQSNSYIEGNWHIKTNFTSNKELSRIDINESIEIKDLGTTLTLTHADISLLSTKLYYEIKDSSGKLINNVTGYDFNTYYSKSMNNTVKLLYNDNSEIDLSDFSFSSVYDGSIIDSYDMEMNLNNYTVMNTSELSAIIINNKIYQID